MPPLEKHHRAFSRLAEEALLPAYLRYFPRSRTWPPTSRFVPTTFTSVPRSHTNMSLRQRNTRLLSRRARVLRPEASWRRMLPIQPPTKIQYVASEISCTCFYERDKGVIAGHFQHLQEPAVSMGFLCDLVIYIRDSNPRSSLFIHWHMFHSGSDGEQWKNVGLWNAISVILRAEWSNECYPPTPEPSGLSVGYFDPDHHVGSQDSVTTRLLHPTFLHCYIFLNPIEGKRHCERVDETGTETGSWNRTTGFPDNAQ